MKIEYVARKVTLNDQVRQLVEKKLGKIRKYFNDILDIRVEVEQERHLYVADLFIKGKDFDLQSKSQNKEITAAIQDAIDKLEIQARRAKARLKDHKQRSRGAGGSWSVDVLESRSIGGGDPRVVEPPLDQLPREVELAGRLGLRIVVPPLVVPAPKPEDADRPLLVCDGRGVSIRRPDSCFSTPWQA